ncbi:MAG: glycosyltransferase [Patescibacteria group bacterium]|nr:glycosyltransferase [Patescibacteria group bacterium]
MNNLKILSLGLDRNLADQNSAVSFRVKEYSHLVEFYKIIYPKNKNKFLAFWKIYKEAKEEITKNNFNVISVQDTYYLALLGVYLAKKYSVGIEIQVHGFEKYRGIRKIIAYFVLQNADSIRVVSNRLRERIKNMGIAERKITTVSIYTDISAISPKLKYEINRKFIFLTVGRLVPVKNIGMQIKAFKEIVNEFPDSELWVVGDGPEKDRFEFNEKVKFFGNQDDLSHYYSSADAFLLTSKSEGWGLVIIEAGAYGLPIIMTDVGCAGEVVINGENGIVIPVEDKKSLIRNMKRIIEDEDLRRKFGTAIRSKVLSLPSKEKTLSLYKESWERCLDFKKGKIMTIVHKLTKHLLFRYIISGGTAAFVDLVLLYIFNTVFDIHYIYASIMAFIVAFFVSFILQKFWTFKNLSKENIHKQVVMYLGSSLFGLSLNTLLMYIFVDYFHLFVLLSQIFAGGLVACCSFFISKKLIFKYDKI